MYINVKIKYKKLLNDIENISNVNKSPNFNEKINSVWEELSIPERQTIEFIFNNHSATREEISNVIGRSKETAVSVLNRLIDKDLIVWTGTTKQDNYGKYIIN